MPPIPVCRKSIPVKISPKPARSAPSDRVLPRAISQRSADAEHGQGGGRNPEAQTEDGHQPDRRGRSERRTDNHPDRLREGDQSRVDEADDGEDGRGGGLNHCCEERPGYNRAKFAGNEPLERAAQGVSREPLQAFGEVVDSEQEQAQSTQKVDGGGGIHGMSLPGFTTAVFLPAAGASLTPPFAS